MVCGCGFEGEMSSTIHDTTPLYKANLRLSIDENSFLVKVV
jgi:hypothetical protein